MPTAQAAILLALSAERPGSLDADMLIDDGYARAIHHFSFFVAIKT